MQQHDPNSLWVPRLFIQLLVVALVVAGLAFFAAYRWYGELAIRDVIGGTITAVLSAYLVHLWLIPWRNAADRDAG